MASVKYPCYYGIGNLVSWLERKRMTPPAFFFFFTESGADADTGRQTQRCSDIATLHLLQRAAVTSCLPLFLWNF